MTLWLLRPFRYLIQVFLKDDSPSQLALGVSFGVAIGLIPKGNLIAAVLSVLVLAFRVNIGTAMLTTFLVTICSGTVDPISHGIGNQLLANATVFEMISTWYRYPLMPWTSLNNTVVLGGSLLGIALFYPSYHLSIGMFEKHYVTVKQRLVRVFQRKKNRQDSDKNTTSLSGSNSDGFDMEFDWRSL